MKAVGRVKAEPRSRSYPLPISGQAAILWECSPKTVRNELASNRILTSACMKKVFSCRFPYLAEEFVQACHDSVTVEVKQHQDVLLYYVLLPCCCCHGVMVITEEGNKGQLSQVKGQRNININSQTLFMLKLSCTKSRARKHKQYQKN